MQLGAQASGASPPRLAILFVERLETVYGGMLRSWVVNTANFVPGAIGNSPTRRSDTALACPIAPGRYGFNLSHSAAAPRASAKGPAATAGAARAGLDRRSPEPSSAAGRGAGGACEAYTSVCSAISRASLTSIPRYRTVLSIFVWPSNSWTARRFFVRR